MPLLKSFRLNTSYAEITKIFIPGILTLMTMGGFFSGFGFIDEMRRGVVDRWLISPINKSSIIFSILASKFFLGIIQIIILMSMAFLYGLRISFLALFLSIMLMNLVAVATISLSHAISIKVKDEGVLAGITRTFYLPLMLLSGIMIPLDSAPNWMQSMALFNPFYYVVKTCRSFFAEDFLNIIVLKGFIVASFFGIFSIWLAIKYLKKEAA